MRHTERKLYFFHRGGLAPFSTCSNGELTFLCASQFIHWILKLRKFGFPFFGYRSIGSRFNFLPSWWFLCKYFRTALPELLPPLPVLSSFSHIHSCTGFQTPICIILPFSLFPPPVSAFLHLTSTLSIFPFPLIIVFSSSLLLFSTLLF